MNFFLSYCHIKQSFLLDQSFLKWTVSYPTLGGADDMLDKLSSSIITKLTLPLLQEHLKLTSMIVVHLLFLYRNVDVVYLRSRRHGGTSSHRRTRLWVSCLLNSI